MIDTRARAGEDRPQAMPREADPWAGRFVVGVVCAAVALTPLLVPTGPGNGGPDDVLILAAIVVAFVWMGSTRQVARLPYGLAVGVMLFAGTVSTMIGPARGLGALALSKDVLLLGWAAAAANVGRSSRGLRAVVATMSWSSIAWAALLLVAVASGNNTIAGITARTGARTSLTFGDPNLAANYFFVSIMVVWASGVPRRRAVRIGGIALLVTALVLTGSNGGLLSLAVGTAFAGATLLARRIGVIGSVAVLFVAAGLVAGASAFVHPLAIEQRIRGSSPRVVADSVGRQRQSVGDRAMLLRETRSLYAQTGLVGTLLGEGPGSTETRLIEEQARFPKEAHDDYAAALVERGVIGFLGLLLLIGSVGARTWSIVSAPLDAGYAAVIPKPAALLGAVAGMAVAAGIYEVLHFRHLWTLLAVIAATQLWGRR